MLEPWEVVLIHLVAGALLLMSAWTRYVYNPGRSGSSSGRSAHTVAIFLSLAVWSFSRLPIPRALAHVKANL